MRTVKSLNLFKASQALFYLNGLIWLAFGVTSLLRVANGAQTQTIILVIVAVLTFGNAAAMLVCGLALGARRGIFFYLALGVLAVNILLTFTDQFGLFDLVTLLIDLALLGILVADRRRYIR